MTRDRFENLILQFIDLLSKYLPIDFHRTKHRLLHAYWRKHMILISKMSHSEVINSFFRSFLLQMKAIPVFQYRSLSPYLELAIKNNSISHMPIFNKADLQNHEDYLYNRFEPYLATSLLSTGTTGQPFINIKPIKEVSYMYFMVIKSIREYLCQPNFFPSLAYINILDSKQDSSYGNGKNQFFEVLDIDPKQGKGMILNTMLTDTNRLKQILKIIKENQVNVISISPDVGDRFCTRLIEEGIRFSDHNICLVITSGNTLRPEIRRKISEYFNAPVMDMIVSSELGLIAAECRYHSGYHIANPFLILEVLKENRKLSGQGSGSLIATNLFNTITPFVRFNTQDIVKLKAKHTCQCGKKGQHLESFYGREVNHFITLKGRKVNPALDPITFLSNGVKQFQLIQESADEITLNYFSSCHSLDKKQRDSISRYLCRLMEGEVKVNFNFKNPVFKATDKIQLTLNRIN